MLSIIGFAIILLILYLIMSKKVAPVVALIAVPVIGLLAAGMGSNLGTYITKGIQSMAPTGVMFIFSIIFFGVLKDAGTFDPIIDFIIKISKGNPVWVVVGTFIIAAVVHLDGSGAVTFLITIPAMLPLYEAIGINKLVLAAVTAMAAGTMNIVPWGGPTLRAASALQMDVMELYRPVIIPQLIGLATGLLFSYLLGKREQKRLIQINGNMGPGEFNYKRKINEEEDKLKRPKLFIPNIILIIFVISIMIINIVPPAAAFMMGTVIAMIMNYPNAEAQRKRVDAHAMEAMLMASVLFAAGVLMGILSNSGMAQAMANSMVAVIPKQLGKSIPIILGYLSMPLSFLFDPDSYYFGVMPVIAEAAKAFGVSAVDIARASIIGEMTLGFPLSPLTASTFLLVGLSGVDLGDHQKFTFKYSWIVSIVIMTSMILLGVFSH